MTKPKKKPKTGDVVGWVVVANNGSVVEEVHSRQAARCTVKGIRPYGDRGPYRIAKIVLAK